ncbi:MAG: hypothetical protein V3V47_03190, partial [Desulfobacteria bacterium]
STKTLVRPCSSEKLLIYELETFPVPSTCYVICGWATGNCLVGEVVWLRIVSTGHRKQHPKPL